MEGVSACTSSTDPRSLSHHCLVSSVVGDSTPLPDKKANATEAEDEAQFDEDAWVEPPFHADYGTNLRLGANVFINFNCTVVDTCLVSIGARTLMGPNISLYSGTHPLDPDLRNGTQGPETGKPITIEEDVWIGGNVTILPGVTVGKGSTVGAGSVVTKVCCCSHLLIYSAPQANSEQERATLHCGCWQPCEVYERRSKAYHYRRREAAPSENCAWILIFPCPSHGQ